MSTDAERADITKWVDKPYDTELQKAAALIDEFRELLSLWQPGMEPTDLTQQAVDHGSLGRISHSRVRDIVQRVFSRRLLKPDERPAQRLKLVLEKGLPHTFYRDVLFVYTYRSHTLIFDFLQEHYWPTFFSGREKIAGAEMRNFISRKAGTERLPNPWSESVVSRVARHMGKALASFGLFEERRAPDRTIRHYQISRNLFRYIICEAHFDGVQDAQLLSLPDWKAFGLEKPEVVSLAESVSSLGSDFLFQFSGDIVQFSWNLDSMEELIDELE